MRLYNITFDAHDPSALATFWSAVLERPVLGWANENFAAIDRTESEPSWLFIRVPEGKTAKNRMHVDLDVDDLEGARRQLESLGGSFVHERNEYGVHWYTFQDPEGNEFCVAQHGE
jgi:predicted enzyme related to lactoylglutathione lyase